MTDTADLDRLAAAADGASVTAEALAAPVGGDPLHTLLEDEQPAYLLRGGLLDIVDTDAPESSADRRRRKVAGRSGDLLTVVTDRRVLALVPREDGAERVSVPLADVTGAETETAPGSHRRLRVHTGGTAYYIDTSKSDAEEGAAAATYVTDHAGGSDGSAGDGSDGDGTDPLAALERLADLHERGALTDEEFAEKKADLLDRI